MKLIISGGRNIHLTRKDYIFLNTIAGSYTINEVVSGGASGVDRCGEDWAKKEGIKIKIFPADWRRWGKMAGPKRNREMSLYADALVFFDGGKGTDSMIRYAQKAGLRIFNGKLREL